MTFQDMWDQVKCGGVARREQWAPNAHIWLQTDPVPRIVFIEVGDPQPYTPSEADRGAVDWQIIESW